MAIHPTAIVDSQARIADSAEIGPYCIIGADVEIGERTRLMAHVFVEGVAIIGEDNLFYPYSTIGVASNSSWNEPKSALNCARLVQCEVGP